MSMPANVWGPVVLWLVLALFWLSLVYPWWFTASNTRVSPAGVRETKNTAARSLGLMMVMMHEICTVCLSAFFLRFVFL